MKYRKHFRSGKIIEIINIKDNIVTYRYLDNAKITLTMTTSTLSEKFRVF